MNRSKVVVFTLVALFGVVSGFTHSRRVTRIFFQPTAGSGNTWKQLTNAYDPSNCVRTNNTYCTYTLSSSATLPSNPTTTQLRAAGAIGYAFGFKYVAL